MATDELTEQEIFITLDVVCGRLEIDPDGIDPLTEIIAKMGGRCAICGAPSQAIGFFRSTDLAVAKRGVSLLCNRGAHTEEEIETYEREQHSKMIGFIAREKHN